MRCLGVRRWVRVCRMAEIPRCPAPKKSAMGVFLLCILCIGPLPACGKKGPPLPLPGSSYPRPYPPQEEGTVPTISFL